MNKGTISIIYDILEKEVTKYRVPVVDLIKVQENDPYKILVATILSSRTKDDVTAQSAKRLFKYAPDMISLSRMNVSQLEKLIFPVGFYKTKAKYLNRLPAAIGSEFRGEIPKSIENLVTLPGVGRKTANLVLALAFDIPAICVDTHVHRIFNRMGYVNTNNPLETEMELRKKLPRDMWIRTNRFFVAFGQNTCNPVLPKCSGCPVSIYCKRKGVVKSR